MQLRPRDSGHARERQSARSCACTPAVIWAVTRRARVPGAICRRRMTAAPRRLAMAHGRESNVDLKAYDVSPECGFLPEPDPEPALPAPLALWQELAAELPKRLTAQRLRASVRSLPAFELA